MSITVAQCRASFEELVPGGSGRFLSFLNQGSERLMQNGAWVGLFSTVDFPYSEGYITLPNQYESLWGCDIRSVPVPIFGQFHEFIESGPGFMEDLAFNFQLLVDCGQFPTQVVQDVPLPIRLTLSNVADVGKTVRLFGYNASGEIYDSTGALGVSLTLANPTVTSSQGMIVTAANKAPTVGSITISSVDGATVTTLSTYSPPETNPQYRRYKVGRVELPANGHPAIRTKCKRRFVPYVNESDQVYPSNLGAIKFALLAMNFEQSAAAGEVAAAETFWAKASELLNQQLRHQRGAARFAIDIPQALGTAAFNSY